jgi:threonine dehydrogenase-like Zn-dependent dehydrogenase
VAGAATARAGALAAVLRAPGSVEVTRAELPEPGPGQVRIRVEGCGVCGSDLPVYAGRPWFDYPNDLGAPGHEAWGTVDALGPDVEGVEAGTRVAALSYRGYATHDLADAGALVPLPRELEAEPFPGEALGCAMNVFARSDIREGQDVAVVGVGFLGALLVQLAARAGARVIGISRREAARDVAREMGAAETLPLDDQAADRVAELTGGELCARVIEAAGRQETLDAAGRLTRTRGHLVIAGFHQDGERRVDMQTWNWRGLDVINAHERDQRVYLEGVRAAAAAVAEGKLDPSPLYTHRFALDQLDEALRTALERPDGFMKALVLP